MRIPAWRAALVALLIGALLSVGSIASATIMVELSLDDMVRDADTIVHATVVRTGERIAMTERGGIRPETITTLRVHEWIAGAGGETVTLRELGGTYQGRTVHYEGTPTYRVGDEVVLFLERRPEAPYDLRTLGMAQGRFDIRHGVPGVPATVRRDLAGIAFARWSDGMQTIEPPGQEPAMDLEMFLQYVRTTRSNMSGGVR